LYEGDIVITLLGTDQNDQLDWNLWKQFSGLPEVWDTRFLQATSPQYPLRPGEFHDHSFRSNVI
jgi:hypothetical protein